MFRNYLAAALRNLVRNRLYAAINIVGLALGFAAALLIALYVRGELSYDTWIPGHGNIYRLSTKLTVATRAGHVEEVTGIPTEAAAWLKLEVPEAEATARMIRFQTNVRHGDVEADEMIGWGDPEFFDIVKFPVLAGDLTMALNAPGDAVITRKIARKYFGVDLPLGQTLELNRAHPLRVVAVIEDMPPNTTLAADIMTSTRASFSPTAPDDALPPGQFHGFNFVPGYLRLRPGADAARIEQGLNEALRQRYPAEVAGARLKIAFRLTPIADVHLDHVFEEGDGNVVKAISAVGVLIVIVALSNFINLMTARSARRAVEVGVRKAVGACRWNLIAQFIGESLLYVGLGAGLAAVLTQILLPSFNAFLQRTMTFDLIHSPEFLLTAGGVTLIAGVLAGTYPALVLSSFPPHATLKNSRKSAASTMLRQGLVICQFAILIGLGLGAVIVYQQTRFGMNQNLRLTRDQVVLIQTACSDVFKNAVLDIPGVRAAACSSMTMTGAVNGTPANLPDGATVILSRAAADFGLLELYGRQPLAGRFFSRDMGTDAADTYGRSGPQMPIVINEKLAHALGFATPNQAIGKSMRWVNQPGSDDIASRPSAIIGVVADFPVRSVTSPIAPMAFFVDRTQAQLLHVKIDGDRLPETLDAIDKVWRQVGEPRPIRRRFFDQYVENMYRDIERQSTMLAGFTMLTVCIASLGLFGLAAFTAEQRTKEIGIRKAMGARTGDLLGLLLWQFTKPVLWANLIAWPSAYVIMRGWLEGFAYHIDQEPWMFLAASGLAVVISLSTVTGHALLVARAQPVTALRYE